MGLRLIFLGEGTRSSFGGRTLGFNRAVIIVQNGTARDNDTFGFNPAVIIVQNGTARDNDTAGGSLNQPVLVILVG